MSVWASLWFSLLVGCGSLENKIKMCILHGFGPENFLFSSNKEWNFEVLCSDMMPVEEIQTKFSLQHQINQTFLRFWVALEHYIVVYFMGRHTIKANSIFKSKHPPYFRHRVVWKRWGYFQGSTVIEMSKVHWCFNEYGYGTYMLCSCLKGIEINTNDCVSIAKMASTYTTYYVSNIHTVCLTATVGCEEF